MDQSAQIQIERLIHTDDKNEFVSFLRNRQENSGFSVSELLKLIVLHHAVGCGTALLEGNTGLDVDFKALLDEGLSPLHIASQSLSYGLTKLFILHGAKTVLFHGDGSNHSVMLPLGAALEAISHHEYVTDWTPKKSVYKLFYIFCLPELKEPLDTVELLASRTTPEKVGALSKCYAREGKVVQLAALLLVAWDILDTPHDPNPGVYVTNPILHCISEELKAVQHELEIIMAEYPQSRLSRAYKRKKVNIECAWKMYHILSETRNVIESYRQSSRPKRVPKHQVPGEVALRFFVDGFQDMQRKDVYSSDIKCLRAQHESKVEGEQSDSVSPGILEDKGCSKKHMHSGPLLGMLARKRAIEAADVPSSSSIYLPSRSFHTHRLCLNSANVINHQLVMKRPLPKFLEVAKICVRLIIATKRCL